MQRTLRRVTRPIRRVGRDLIRIYRHRTAEVCPNPVFIGGSPKSGTTAIAALLAQATGSKFSNDPFWNVFRRDGHGFLLPDVLDGTLGLECFVKRYPAYFAAGIVKDPDFAFLYRDLRHLFPGSSQVFIVRDPRQNIRSILNRLHMRGDLENLGADEQRTLAAEGGWRAILEGRGLGLDERANYVGRLAQRWVRGVESYLASDAWVQLLRYEDFVGDKMESIARLADVLGLRLTRDIRDELDRQYQPRGNRSISMEAFFGRKNLSVIEDTCAKHMSRFGYA
ncbi:sulfotransferase family protein [Frateuria sp. YIM B11624]|uniref:sulfotransferase family protein n=1 Tax=Frateuria sp. YIM B11624 TaxID=3143185 RepID=UPI003C76ADC9